MIKLLNNRSILVDVSALGLCFVLLSIFGASFGVVLVSTTTLSLLIIRRIDWKRHPTLKRWLQVLVLLFILSFVIVEGLVISEIWSDDSKVEKIDYVIVLGAGLRGTELSQTLRLRLDRSLDIINSRADIPIILSGGQGPGEDISEAEAMRNYLLRHGVSDDRIILEDKSTSTEENIRFSMDLAAEQGILKPKLLLVTSDYHMYRAKWIARQLGSDAYGLSSESPFYLKLNYMLREYFALTKDMVFEIVS
jgi:uncharacterized SAM-binding protein YcdF (DUF218 family)